MTPQEILTEIRKLPIDQRQRLRESLDKDEPAYPLTQEEVLESLYARGIIGNIPNPDAFDEDDDFELIEMSGEPLSEMIIRERR